MERFALTLVISFMVALAIVAARDPINAWLQGTLERATVSVERLRGPDPAIPATLDPAPVPRWTYPGLWLSQRPVIDADGRIYLTTREDLLALDSAGRELLRRSLAGGQDARPGALRRLGDGRVVLPIPGGLKIFATDGTQLATLALTAPADRPRAPVELADGTLVTTTRRQNAFEAGSLLVALAPDGTGERWRFDAAQHRVEWLLPTDDGRLYVSIDGTRWQFDAAGQRSAVSGAYKALAAPIVITGRGEILHLPRWDFVPPPGLAEHGITRPDSPCRPVHVTLARDGLAAYFACNDTLYATSLDGSLRWSRQLDWLAPYPLTLAPDGGVYVVVAHGLQGFTADGRQRFRVELWRTASHSGASAPVTAAELSVPPKVAPDGTVYLGTQDNGIYAITSDGRIRWHYAGRDADRQMGYVTHLAFLDGLLLVSASGLTALPSPSARLEPIAGEDFHDAHD